MEEFRRLQEEMAQAPRLKSEIETLERALIILEEEKQPVQKTRLREREIMDSLAPESGRTKPVADYVVEVLREAGKPLPLSQIIPLILVKGSKADTATVRGALYRNAKAKRLVKLIQPGVFGLLEWH
jgi:hypothetical protein